MHRIDEHDGTRFVELSKRSVVQGDLEPRGSAELSELSSVRGDASVNAATPPELRSNGLQADVCEDAHGLLAATLLWHRAFHTRFPEMFACMYVQMHATQELRD